MKTGNLFNVISDAINKYSFFILCILMVVMVVVVLLGVVNRFLMKFTISWTEELARYTMIWITMLGSGVALKKGGHIAITFLIDKMTDKLLKPLLILGNVLIITFLMVNVLYGIKLCFSQYGQISPSLRISIIYPFSIIPIGCLIMIIHLVSLTHKLIERRKIDEKPYPEHHN